MDLDSALGAAPSVWPILLRDMHDCTRCAACVAHQSFPRCRAEAVAVNRASHAHCLRRLSLISPRNCGMHRLHIAVPRVCRLPQVAGGPVYPARLHRETARRRMPEAAYIAGHQLAIRCHHGTSELYTVIREDQSLPTKPPPRNDSCALLMAWTCTDTVPLSRVSTSRVPSRLMPISTLSECHAPGFRFAKRTSRGSVDQAMHWNATAVDPFF
ncbi:hypothetical protein PSPO01_09165 [Paraphaeosphaeria sporulosa]